MRNFELVMPISALCAMAVAFAGATAASHASVLHSRGDLELKLADPVPMLVYDTRRLLEDRELLSPMMHSVRANIGTDDRATDCLSKAVYYEARSQSADGQRAVAQVVLNRVGRPGFAGSVCDVVYQGSQALHTCQFKFTCDGSMSAPVERPAWAFARKVALSALHGFTFVPIGNATFYHNFTVHPEWSNRFVRVAQIGSHIFYRGA